MKVAAHEGILWYVAKLDCCGAYGGVDDAYLMLHMDIANTSLRKAAVDPNVEVC